MKPKLYKPPSVLPLIKRIGRVSFKPVAIAVVSLSVIGVLVTSVPYVWNLPKEEVTVLLKEPTVKGKPSPKEKAELIDKYRSTLISGIGTVATIIGGFVLIVNVYLALRKLKQDADKNEVDKNLAESRLISERFSKAIEQLGSESIHIRLGGIYSLEKIATESPDDHWTVMEVLTAFIREESSAEERRDENGKIMICITEAATDVKAAFTVIGRREVHERSGQSTDKGTFNLNVTNLNGVELSKANLSRVKLRSVSLRSANLDGANLEKADLSLADLSKTNLGEANLLFADLSSTNLEYATLYKTCLVAAEMGGANLYRSQFPFANLSHANLTGANLTHSHLMGARLEKADLTGAKLNGSNLVAADMKQADLSDANLSDANLNGAQNLTEEQLETALLCHTHLPEGINIDPDRDCEKLKSLKSWPFSN
jgi:uncharacterized protein YjbI with pentapeptide repeats